jgi:hypothetical protein
MLYIVFVCVAFVERYNASLHLVANSQGVFLLILFYFINNTPYYGKCFSINTTHLQTSKSYH